ncbi:MAG: TadG family pilus assembly protein [Rhodanobacter sp.]
MMAMRHGAHTVRGRREVGDNFPGYRQRGSMAIAMMLMLIGLISMLGLVEVGYLYWAKRDTQKVADLASLAGAQQLQDCAANNGSNTAAYANAYTENGFIGAGTTLTIACGTWDPVANAGIPDAFAPVATGVSPNAVKVIASRPVLPIWGFAGALPTVSTEAVSAGQSPIAAFSVGTTLVAVSGTAPLGQLLQGIGIKVDGAELVGYSGLATANISPAGLLQQLGVTVPANISVGDLNTLLASTVNAHALIDVLNAVVTVAGDSSLVSANATLLSDIEASVPGISLGTVTLGGPGGIFATIVAPDNAGEAALNANVNALQIITTAIGVATGQHAVTAAGDLSLGLLNVTYATSVIEPPSIGVGGVGTTAYTAQIRTFIHITTPPTGLTKLLGGLIDLNVNLPIAIDLVTAEGVLTGLCDTTSSTGAPQATIGVTSSVLKMCVGNMTEANAFSTVGSCDGILGASTPMPLLGLSIAGANIASLNTSLVTNALTASGSGSLAAGQSAIIPAGGTPLNIGTSVNNLVTALTAALVATPSPSTTFNPTTSAAQTATDLWNGTNTSLSYAARTSAALNEIQTASTGFSGLLGNVTSSVLGVLGDTVTLNVPGLLGDVGNLLGGVTNALSGVLNNVVCDFGGSTACINVISGAITAGGGTGSNSSAFIGLLSFLLQALQPALNGIGTDVLTPVLTGTLGLELGQTTVNVQSLECHRVQLVY